MKIKEDSFLPLDALKGALVTNEHDCEFRIHGFSIRLDEVTNVLVELKAIDEDGKLDSEVTCGVSIHALESWTIQLQGETP